MRRLQELRQQLRQALLEYDRGGKRSRAEDGDEDDEDDEREATRQRRDDDDDDDES